MPDDNGLSMQDAITRAFRQKQASQAQQTPDQAASDSQQKQGMIAKAKQIFGYGDKNE